MPARFDRRDTLFCVVVVLLGVAWRANASAVGPLSDDYLHHGMVHGLVAGSFAPWDLYALFADEPAARAGQLSAGLVPWWTAPDFRGEVLRPLPSLLLWIDHTVWPRRPVVHHVHSLLWWAALLAVTGWALRRLLPRAIAWTALALFAVDPSASMPVAWLANRAALVSATLGFVAVAAHVRWRRDGRGGPGAPAAAMVATFAAGEYGFVAAGYVVAYEVFGHRRRDRDEPRWVVRLAPAVVPAVAYLAWHVAGGYGMVGAEFYAHPFEDPLGYLRWLWLRGPRLVAALVAPLPASTAVLVQRYPFDPATFGGTGPMAAVHAHLVLAWLAIGTVATVAWVLRGAWTDDERRTLKWLTLGAVVGTLPVAVAPSHARLLLLSQLGGCALVAGVLVAAARSLRRGPTWRRVIAALTLGLGAWGHGPADAWFARTQIDDYAALSRTATEAALAAGDVGGRHVVVLSTSVQTVMLHGALVADYHGRPGPSSWHVLSSTPAPLGLRRDRDDALELWHLNDASWLDTLSARIFRPPPRTMPAGERVAAGPLTMEVLADRDGRPVRVRATFDPPLSDPRWAFFVLRGMQLRPFAMPTVGSFAFAPVPDDR